jgi:hypothetical protein
VNTTSRSGQTKPVQTQPGLYTLVFEDGAQHTLTHTEVDRLLAYYAPVSASPTHVELVAEDGTRSTVVATALGGPRFDVEMNECAQCDRPFRDHLPTLRCPGA